MELTNSLQRDTVRDLRPQAPVVLGPEQSVREAIAAMQCDRRGCVLICDDLGQILGIFTERDVLHRVIGEHVELDSPLKKVMSVDVVSVTASDPITRVVELFHGRGFRHLAVVDDAGKITGVLSVKRMVEYLVEHCPEAVYNLPPRPPSMESREGA